MGYREIAAQQRGLLLHNQVTEEEYDEAVAAGFIGIPPYEQDQELMKYVHYTELAEYSYIDAYYRDWLIAFPTIPPEKRHPTPYIAGMRAIRIQRFSTSWTMEPSSIITRRGYSWDEIAWAIEPAAGVWCSDKTGKRPTNGKELLELFFEEHTPAPRQTDNEPE